MVWFPGTQPSATGVAPQGVATPVTTGAGLPRNAQYEVARRGRSNELAQAAREARVQLAEHAQALQAERAAAQQQAAAWESAQQQVLTQMEQQIEYTKAHLETPNIAAAMQRPTPPGTLTNAPAFGTGSMQSPTGDQGSYPYVGKPTLGPPKAFADGGELEGEMATAYRYDSGGVAAGTIRPHPDGSGQFQVWNGQAWMSAATNQDARAIANAIIARDTANPYGATPDRRTSGPSGPTVDPNPYGARPDPRTSGPSVPDINPYAASPDRRTSSPGGPAPSAPSAAAPRSVATAQPAPVQPQVAQSPIAQAVGTVGNAVVPEPVAPPAPPIWDGRSGALYSDQNGQWFAVFNMQRTPVTDEQAYDIWARGGVPNLNESEFHQTVQGFPLVLPPAQAADATPSGASPEAAPAPSSDAWPHPTAYGPNGEFNPAMAHETARQILAANPDALSGPPPKVDQPPAPGPYDHLAPGPWAGYGNANPDWMRGATDPLLAGPPPTTAQVPGVGTGTPAVSEEERRRREREDRLAHFREGSPNAPDPRPFRKGGVVRKELPARPPKVASLSGVRGANAVIAEGKNAEVQIPPEAQRSVRYADRGVAISAKPGSVILPIKGTPQAMDALRSRIPPQEGVPVKKKGKGFVPDLATMRPPKVRR